MSSRVSHSTVGGHTYLRLRQLARDTNRTTDELIRLYALEGLLARLGPSRHQDRFVLKGGVLMAAYGLRRATRDVDLQARSMTNDTDQVLRLIRTVAGTELEDGLVYAAGSAQAAAIREDDDYQGVRVSLTAELATARIALHVDVNVGDPIWPGPRPITVPGLLGRAIELLGYPIVMVHAEKIVTALDRGVTNTRWRDLADVCSLSHGHPVGADDLRAALDEVARYRGVRLAPLAEVLRGWPGLASTRWAVWRRRQGPVIGAPVDFADALATVIAFVDPVITGTAAGTRWDPTTRRWIP
jgi:hypothetical protein